MSDEPAKPTWVQCLDMAGEVLRSASSEANTPAMRDQINHTAYAWMALADVYKNAPEPKDDDSGVITALIDSVESLDRRISDLFNRVDRLENVTKADRDAK